MIRLKIGLKVRIVYFTSSYFILKQDDERSYNITGAFKTKQNKTTHNRANISLFLFNVFFVKRELSYFFVKRYYFNR